MRIGLRGAWGQSQITIDGTATVAELLVRISEASSLPEFEVRSGFPPRPIDFATLDPTLPLSDTGLQLNGQRLQVDAKHDETRSKDLLQTKAAAQSAGSSLSKGTWQEEPRTTKPSSTKPVASLKKKTTDVEKDPPEVPLHGNDSKLIQRVMPDDNSCLFRAVGKCVFGNSIDGMTELRSMVAQNIQADTDRYNSVVLEKDPDEYCKWIQNPDSWGGAIEIGIIAEAFGIEICAVNVQDGSVQRFNEGQSMRSYLVYSGIHWDTIVENCEGKWGPVDFDISQFSSFDDEILEKAQQIGVLLNRAGYYTDTQTFGIKCNICGWMGSGEKGAIEHMAQTTHMDFEQVE